MAVDEQYAQALRENRELRDALRELVESHLAVAHWRSTDGLGTFRERRARNLAAWQRAQALIDAPGVEPSPLTQRWAVFCKHCRKEWTVAYEHPGADVCEACAAGGVPATDQGQCLRDGVAESVLDTRNGNADWTKAGTGVNSPTSPGLISRKAYTGSAGSNPAAVAPPSVDWLGLALDLEAQAKRVESQTVERAMLAGAHGLRLMGAAATSVPAADPVQSFQREHLGEPYTCALNGIPATWQHDEGAYAQCGDCGRYTLNPRALRVSTHRCECGSTTGWSGSFKKPGPDAKWSGEAPDGVSGAHAETFSRRDAHGPGSKPEA